MVSCSGPMAATMATLEGLGWVPRTPYAWLAPSGDEWKFVAGDTFDVMHALKSDAESQVWQAVATQHCGLGLQNGADVSVLKRHLLSLRRKQQPGHASLLFKIATSQIWASNGKREAGIPVAQVQCAVCVGQ